MAYWREVFYRIRLLITFGDFRYEAVPLWQNVCISLEKTQINQIFEETQEHVQYSVCNVYPYLYWSSDIKQIHKMTWWYFGLDYVIELSLGDKILPHPDFVSSQYFKSFPPLSYLLYSLYQSLLNLSRERREIQDTIATTIMTTRSQIQNLLGQ